MLICQGIRKSFATPGDPVVALNGVDLAIEPGEFVAIMGPSGSGKTTLLQILGGLDRPTEGVIRFGDHDYAQLSEERLTVLRRRQIGYIFQSFNLVPGLTAAENVGLSLILDGRRPTAAEVDRALEEVGLGRRKHHRPVQLSGGEQQRVAVARALLARPAVILADEPTASLDATNREVILTLLRKAADEGQAVVMVTHDHQSAAHADRILQMRDGRIVDHVKVNRSGAAEDPRARLRRHLAGEVNP